MEQRVDVITLGVPDWEAAHRFYVDGLGWEPTMVVPGEITFVQAGHGRLLALWRADALAADLGRESPGAAPGGVTLGHNVATRAEIDEVLGAAAAAGGEVLIPTRDAPVFHGAQGYFADPAGYIWDVVWNPGVRFETDGRVIFGGDE